MDENKQPTVESSLEMLSEAIGKASEDLCSVRASLDEVRSEIASRNTSISREVIRDAERAIDNMRRTDESLRAVLKDLAQRD